jgi:very-short-patch-repair endonuclease
MTLPETRLWRTLRKLELNVRRQVPIGPYIADFAILQSCLLIEVDGGIHDLPEKQLRDERKDTWLKVEGYRVLRFRNEQVLSNQDAVVECILASLPPRGGKGRDGGERATISEWALEAGEAKEPHALFLECRALTPTQPSPLEGEGALNSDGLLYGEGALSPELGQ